MQNARLCDTGEMHSGWLRFSIISKGTADRQIGIEHANRQTTDRSKKKNQQLYKLNFSSSATYPLLSIACVHEPRALSHKRETLVSSSHFASLAAASINQSCLQSSCIRQVGLATHSLPRPRSTASSTARSSRQLNVGC